MAKRMAFANWALTEFEENSQWLLSVLWMDLAHILLNGVVNTHNCRIWAKENPHAMLLHRGTSTCTTLLFSVVLTWKLLWVPFSLKSLVQERHVQSVENVT